MKVNAQGGTTTIAEYRYNGLGHRIGWKARFDTGLTYASNKWRHFQYNERWQQLAMYEGGTTVSGAVADALEQYTYLAAGLDGYGGSSSIDAVVCRERPKQGDRHYYLQNWRNDVVAIMNYDGQLLERVTYDAYGRPHSFSPADVKTSGGADRPDGVLDASDTWSTGSVAWNKDIGNASDLTIPDGVVDSHDGTVLTNLKKTGYTGGYGLLSDKAIDNRKGFAGYEFDPILNGAAGVNNKPVYHARHRVLASDSGKWFERYNTNGVSNPARFFAYANDDPIDTLPPGVSPFPSTTPPPPPPEPQSITIQRLLCDRCIPDDWLSDQRLVPFFAAAQSACAGCSIRIICSGPWLNPNGGGITLPPLPGGCPSIVVSCPSDDDLADPEFQRNLMQTISHELIHAMQWCRGLWRPFSHCEDALCGELQAYLYESRAFGRTCRNRDECCAFACDSITMYGCNILGDCMRKCKCFWNKGWCGPDGRFHGRWTWWADVFIGGCDREDPGHGQPQPPPGLILRDCFRT